MNFYALLTRVSRSSTERRKLRPVQSILIAASASALGVAFALAVALAVFGLDDSALFQVGVPACALAIFLYGLFRIAVEADEHGLVVTNIWKTHRLSWAAVQEIDVAGVFWPSAAAFVYIFTPLRISHRRREIGLHPASIYDVERVSD